ncbi:MAG: hypothetical protein F6K14_08370 [Symploca sp. SIO2C1]|nr:hypothetical protein [Symploca sp. SIO2C1]
MTKRRANQLISSALVMENLNGNNCSHILPANEAQIRFLTSLTSEQQLEVWQKAVETAPNGKPTAKLVKEIAEKYDSDNHDQVLLSTEAKRISDALSTLSKYEIGQIRETIFSPEGEQLGMPELARKVGEKFNHLELVPLSEKVGNIM